MGVTFIYFVIIKLQMNALSLALQFITVLNPQVFNRSKLTNHCPIEAPEAIVQQKRIYCESHQQK